MRELDIERLAVRQQVARALGDDSRIGRGTVADVRIIGLEADILALPRSPVESESIQIMDSSSSDFGSFRFVAGVSKLDDESADLLI